MPTRRPRAGNSGSASSRSCGGTAYGIKLLDIINPTDYRHFVQDTMEDSRIPVWMFNVERNMGNAGGVQFIVAQAKPNLIPGLDSGGDQGQPFVLQGVDAITGVTVQTPPNPPPTRGEGLRISALRSWGSQRLEGV